MKKIILLILMMTLLPILAFAKLQVETYQFDYAYDWISFLGRGKQEYGKEGNWKYGYKDFDASTEHEWRHYYIPNKPKGYKVPEYLKNYPIINKNINASNIKDAMFKESDAVRLIKADMEMFCNSLSENRIVFGVTKNNDWFVVNNNFIQNRHNKYRPFRDACISIQKTIKMHCEEEKREPTLSEKYIMLYIDSCVDLECNEKDREYKRLNYDSYRKDVRAEQFAQVIGIFKVIGWCLLALFAFALPGLVLASLQFIFPKDSAIYKAVTILEWILGIFIVTYWFGSRR